MAKEFSKPFYHSAQWLSCREAYAKSKGYICERCGRPGSAEVHHIMPLTPDNIHDPSITTDFSNLMLCCHKCHRDIHRQMERGEATEKRYTVDWKTGEVIVK